MSHVWLMLYISIWFITDLLVSCVICLSYSTLCWDASMHVLIDCCGFCNNFSYICLPFCDKINSYIFSFSLILFLQCLTTRFADFLSHILHCRKWESMNWKYCTEWRITGPGVATKSRKTSASLMGFLTLKTTKSTWVNWQQLKGTVFSTFIVWGKKLRPV